jgi:hypothetical protein
MLLASLRRTFFDCMRSASRASLAASLAFSFRDFSECLKPLIFSCDMNLQFSKMNDFR